MLRFLWWNTNRKPLLDSIARLAIEHNLDVVLLAESALAPATLLTRLNARAAEYHYVPHRQCDRVRMYTRFPLRYVEEILATSRYAIRRVRLPEREEFLLVAAHLTSKLYASRESQFSGAAEFARSIREAEAAVGHRRTLLVGDLNMDPYESGIVAANGLHAVMTRAIAEKAERQVEGQPYPFFYNPMWCHYGDRQPPPGSYFRHGSQYVEHFWHLFDQVLVRPDLLRRFDSGSVRILASDGDASLLTQGGVPKSVYSDHLPLIFGLNA